MVTFALNTFLYNSMDIIEALPVPFYQFQCLDETLLDIVQTEVSSLDFNDEDPPPSTRDYYNKELFQWFEDCLLEVKKIYYKESLNLTISNGFATRMKKMQKARLHYHINSIVSGVFYLTTSTSSKTRFFLPTPWYFPEHANILSISNNTNKSSQDISDKFYNAITTYITPVRGKLVLFPSNIDHDTVTHTENFTRYIISFNTMVSGILSSKNTTKLQIDTIPHII